MRPENGHILASPEPNFVVSKPVKSQEYVLYLVTLHPSMISTHNRVVDQSFKRLVATSCNCSHILIGCGCGCGELGCQTGHGLVAPKKSKKPDQTGLLNTTLRFVHFKN